MAEKIYDEKANTVTITVVCCSPEKEKKMICCKGGKTVKGIEILKPKPPPTPEKKSPEPEKKPPEPEKKPPKDNGPGTVYPPRRPPARLCCRECYEGVGGSPCWEGYGRPVGPCYCRCYGRPVCKSWGCSYCKGYYTSRFRDCICEENPSACTIM